MHSVRYVSFPYPNHFSLIPYPNPFSLNPFSLIPYPNPFSLIPSLVPYPNPFSLIPSFSLGFPPFPVASHPLPRATAAPGPACKNADKRHGTVTTLHQFGNF